MTVGPRTQQTGQTDLRRRRLWWFLLGLGVVAMVSSGIPLLTQTAVGRASQDAGTVPVERAARAQPTELPDGSSKTRTKVSSTRPSARPAAETAAVPQWPHLPPVRLTVRRLDIDAAVLPVSVRKDGLLGVPDNPRRLGWWSESSRPGMPSGSVVIDGHVDSATLGLGAFFRLHEARPGDEVLTMDVAGSITRYTVAARRTYAKELLPVSEVFARDVGPRLVLVTCGGRFDQATRHYADNVVIYAVQK